MVGIPFTTENAREMQQRAQAAKAARVEEMRKTLETLRQPSDDFREDMLKSTRAQMRLIAGRMDKELESAKLDSKVLKELSETMTRLEAIEQKLSMRSGPGTLKPSSKPPKGRTSANPPPEPQDDPGTTS